MPLDDFSFAADFRDVVELIARKVIMEERPDYRVGRVFSYNLDTQFAEILLPGDTIENMVKARFANNMRPTLAMDASFDTLGYDAPGDVVRVNGRTGSYWIADFLAGTPDMYSPGKFDYTLAGMKCTTAQSIPNNTPTAVSFNTTDLPAPTGGLTTGSAGITIADTGTYLITGQAGINPSAAIAAGSVLRVGILFGASVNRYVSRGPLAPFGAPTMTSWSVMARLTIGQTVGIEMWHNAGADAVLYNPTAYQTQLQVCRVAL